MTEALNRGEDARCAAAADWVVRLQSPHLAADSLLDFDGWLGTSPSNAAAYDAALLVMLEMQASAAEIARAISFAPTNDSRPAPRRGWMIAGGLAAAATVALALMPFGQQVATQSYLTGKGEHRSVKLADGTVIDLNAGTQITVALGPHDRRVAMPQGEAVFDVATDKSRPFLIAAGDRTVRVVGTRFDVRRRGEQLSVTVDRGLVEVRPDSGAPGRTFRLHPGQRLDHAEGALDARISAAQPSEVFSWRSGRLIYREQPLGEVIADLNQQFARPILLEDSSLAAIPVSGVLVLDDQSAVIRRLALLAPLSAIRSERGVTLRRDAAARP